MLVGGINCYSEGKERDGRRCSCDRCNQAGCPGEGDLEGQWAIVSSVIYLDIGDALLERVNSIRSRISLEAQILTSSEDYSGDGGGCINTDIAPAAGLQDPRLVLVCLKQLWGRDELRAGHELRIAIIERQRLSLPPPGQTIALDVVPSILQADIIVLTVGVRD